MHRLIALLLLAGCSAAPTPVALGRYRAPDAPIYSNAVLDTPRLVGRWTQVATFGAQDGCKPGGAEFAQAAGGLNVTYRLCQSGQQMQGAGALTPIGPGRFQAPNQPAPWWILWADVDYRTLVIGSPDGRIGFILNRGGFPQDRVKAAREILDWNGYDLKRLVVY
jgi:apolipoprotein D and lipocalin family protein